MNIRVYIPDEKIEGFYIDALKEYEKRLARYCKIELIRFKDNKQLDNTVPDKSYRILLSPSGKRVTSEELAKYISALGLSGVSDIAIIIGNITLACNDRLALSSLDMALGLQTTALYEQIYRAYRIINNHAYHK